MRVGIFGERFENLKDFTKKQKITKKKSKQGQLAKGQKALDLKIATEYKAFMSLPNEVSFIRYNKRINGEII